MPIHRNVTQTRFSLRSNLVCSTRDNLNETQRGDFQILCFLSKKEISFWPKRSRRLFRAMLSAHPLKKGPFSLHRTEKVHQNMGQSRRLTQSSDFFICVRTEVSFSFYSRSLLFERFSLFSEKTERLTN